MKRFIRLFVMFGLLLLLAAPLTAQDTPTPEPVGLRPDAPTYAQHGPYWVGTREFVIEPDSERPLPATIWYPALNPQGSPETTTYSYQNFATIAGFTEPGHALANAAPDLNGGSYPLVIISHGAVGYRYDFAYLAEHLASYGFVTMTIDHTGDTIAYATDPQLAGANYDVWLKSFADSFVTRPLDIQRSIDFASSLTAQGGDLAGLIDPGKIAVAGHSSGGWTALTSAGAQIDLRPIAAWCKANSSDEAISTSMGYTLFCSTLVASEASILSQRQVAAKPGELWPSYPVTGVDAVVSISPGPVFSADSFANVTVPTLMLVGSQDPFPTLYDSAVADYQSLPTSSKGLVVFQNAGHSYAAGMCNDWLVSYGWYSLCSDTVWDMDRSHDLTDQFVTAFLLDVLKGDKDAHAALAPDTVSFPGITYQAQGF